MGSLKRRRKMKISLKGTEVTNTISVPDPDQYTGMTNITIERTSNDSEPYHPLATRPSRYTFMLTPEQLHTLGQLFIARSRQMKKEAA